MPGRNRRGSDAFNAYLKKTGKTRKDRAGGFKPVKSALGRLGMKLGVGSRRTKTRDAGKVRGGYGRGKRG